MTLLQGDIPQYLITKRFDIAARVGEKKFKTFPWTAPSPGTYHVVSSVPGMLVPITDEVKIFIGQDHKTYIRVMLVPTKVAMKSEAAGVVRREDVIIVACLQFGVTFSE